MHRDQEPSQLPHNQKHRDQEHDHAFDRSTNTNKQSLSVVRLHQHYIHKTIIHHNQTNPTKNSNPLQQRDHEPQLHLSRSTDKTNHKKLQIHAINPASTKIIHCNKKNNPQTRNHTNPSKKRKNPKFAKSIATTRSRTSISKQQSHNKHQMHAKKKKTQSILTKKPTIHQKKSLTTTANIKPHESKQRTIKILKKDTKMERKRSGERQKHTAGAPSGGGSAEGSPPAGVGRSAIVGFLLKRRRRNRRKKGGSFSWFESMAWGASKQFFFTYAPSFLQKVYLSARLLKF